MKNRTPTQVLENGALRYAVYDEQGNFLRYEWFLLADEPTQQGTPFATETMLKDTTAALLGLPATAVPDDALAAIAQFGLKKQVYDTAGTYTFVAPYTGSYFVEICGAGGGSSGSRVGGGGGYAAKNISLLMGETVTITVPPSVQLNTSAGGETCSFGSYMTATGGGRSTGTLSGAGGVPTGGDINVPGIQGGAAQFSYTDPYGSSYMSAGACMYGKGGTMTTNSGAGAVIITMKGVI